MNKILYIAGYGRSGSTYLDRKLTIDTESVGVGELSYLSKEFLDEKYCCSCGEVYSKCRLWSIPNIDHEKLSIISNEYESPFSIFKKLRKEYSTPTSTIMDTAFSFYNAKVLIDSSKSCRDNALRPIRLKQLGYNVNVIHLKRPLRSVLKSVQKGTNKKLAGQAEEKSFRVFRAIFSWIYSNIIAHSFRYVRGIEYIYVDQEELLLNPDSVVRKISTKFELERRKSNLVCQHVVAGNRSKYEG
ncbi:hypothetical protein AB4256_11640 [Vibrio breoganii]